MSSSIRRKALPLATVLATTLILSGCGEDNGGGDASAEDTITLRAGTGYNPNVALNRCGFAELEDSEELREVGIQIDNVDSGQLGNDAELLEQASRGELDIALGFGTTLAMLFDEPRFQLIEAYYLAQSSDDVDYIQESDIVQNMWADLEDSANLVNIGSPWLWGERHIFSQEPVRTPDDLQGMEMRVPSGEMSRASASALGASVVDLNYGEIYLGLQQGIMDAIENPLSVSVAESFDEQVNYVNLTGHLYNTQGVLINKDRWESLSEEQQQVLDAEVARAAEEVESCLLEDDQAALDEWNESGEVEIVEDVDREAFAELAKAEYSEGYEWSDDYLTLLQELEERR